MKGGTTYRETDRQVERQIGSSETDRKARSEADRWTGSETDR